MRPTANIGPQLRSLPRSFVALVDFVFQSAVICSSAVLGGQITVIFRGLASPPEGRQSCWKAELWICINVKVDLEQTQALFGLL